MATVKAIHYNTPLNDGKTRCGRKLSKVNWREDTKDVTCNQCNNLLSKDILVGRRQ